MPALSVLPVNQRRVLSDSVIPHDHSPFGPLDAGLEVSAIGKMVVQELEDGVRLFLLEPDNVAGDCWLTVRTAHKFKRERARLTLWVHVNRLFPRRWMRPDNRMLINHRLPTLDAPPRSRRIHLLDTRMRRLESMQALPKQRTEPIIRLHGIHKQRVAPRLGLVKDIQKRRPRRLLLIRYVRMPRHTARAVRKKLIHAIIPRSAMHQVNLGKPFGRPGGRVDVVSAEIAAKLQGFFNRQVGEILVAESDHLALRDQQSEFVFAGGSELGELDPVDLGANGGRQVGDFADSVGEEVGKSWIGVTAMLIMLKRLEGRVFLLGVPGGEIVRVVGGRVAVLVARFGIGVIADGGNVFVDALVNEVLGLDYVGDSDAFCGGGGH